MPNKSEEFAFPSFAQDVGLVIPSNGVKVDIPYGGWEPSIWLFGPAQFRHTSQHPPLMGIRQHLDYETPN